MTSQGYAGPRRNHLYTRRKKSLAYLVQARHDLKEVLNDRDGSGLASETAHTLMDEVHVDELLEKEKERREEESSRPIDFNMMVRSIDSRCW